MGFFYENLWKFYVPMIANVGRVYATRFWGCVRSTKTCFIRWFQGNEIKNVTMQFYFSLNLWKLIIVKSVFFWSVNEQPNEK